MNTKVGYLCVAIGVYLASLFGIFPSHASAAYPPETVAATSHAEEGYTVSDLTGSGAWHIETVDSEADVGMRNSLALDESGFAHVSYYDESNMDLKYAWEDTSGWHTEVVDSADIEVGYTTSLALDANGAPHISYFDSTNAAVMYAYKDGSEWQIEIVDAEAGEFGEYVSLALGNDGKPHISYRRFISFFESHLKYAHRDQSGWHTETVDDNDEVGAYTSLQLNGDGYPQISYRDDTAGELGLKFAYQDESGWHLESLSTGFYNDGRYTSMALDSSQQPHISHYMAVPIPVLIYTYRDGSGWHTETIIGGVGAIVGLNTALAIDQHDQPHVAFHMSGEGIYYAHKQGATWQSSPILDPGGAAHVSLALTADGNPVISYYNKDKGALEIARYTDLLDIYLPVVLAGS